MKFAVLLAIITFMSFSSCDSHSAVRTVTSTSYALRPCSTCKEVVYSTEAECRAAGEAEASRVGLTRTSGSAVYTCITRFNVIATFYPNAVVRQAMLSWTYTPADGTPVAEGFRIFYGTNPAALVSVVQLDNSAARSYTISNLAPGTYYFAMKSFAGGNESLQSIVISKVVL